MRLVFLSTVLPLMLGLAGCAAPGVESLESGSAPDDEVEEVLAGAAPEINAKAAEVVTSIEGVLKLYKTWSARIKAAATTPEARREIEQLVQKMRGELATLPAEAEWVTHYIEQNREAVKAGFARELASEPIQTKLGHDKVQTLIEAVNRAGGIDKLILESAATVHDHSQELSDQLGHGKKMSLTFFSGLAGTYAGANAARENWKGVLGPVLIVLRARHLL